MNQYQTETPTNSKKSMIPLMLALMLALGIVNILFFVNRSKVNERLVGQLDEKSIVIIQLNDKYSFAVRQLDSLKSANPRLVGEIDSLRYVLLKQKKAIEAGLKNKTDLDAALHQIAALVSQKQDYLDKIKGLEMKLTETTQQLAAALEKNDVTMPVSEEKSVKPTVQSQSVLVKEEKKLLKKADLAYFTIDNIKVSLYHINRRNKKAKVASAKDIDRINFCFDVAKNEDIIAGLETFHIRLLEPNGDLLYKEELGSSLIKPKHNDPAFRYTTTIPHLYEDTSGNLCGYWEQPNNSFVKGEYKIEVYHRGHLSGKSSFKMR